MQLSKQLLRMYCKIGNGARVNKADMILARVWTTDEEMDN